MMQDQMAAGPAMGMPQDPSKAFKAEWEALEISDHNWALEHVEDDVLSGQLSHAHTTQVENLKSKLN